MPDSDQNNSSSIIVFERLQAGVVIRHFNLFVRAIFNKQIIYYIEASYWIRGLISLFRLLWKPFSFRMIEAKTKQKELSLYEINHQILPELAEHVLKDEYFVVDNKCQKFDVKLYKTYLAKSLMAYSYGEGRMLCWQRCMFVFALFNKFSLKREKIFYINQDLGINIIQSFARQYGVDVRFSGSCFDLVSFCKRLFKYNTLTRCFLFKWLLKTRKLKSFTSVEQDQMGGLKIGLQYYGLLNIDKPDCYSDAAFLQIKSNLNKKDFVWFTSLTIRPITEEIYHMFNQHGMKCLALHPKATVTRNVSVFLPPLRKAQNELFRVKTNFNDSEKSWINSQVSSYLKEVNYWNSLYSSAQIKIFITWFKYGKEHIPAVEAIRQLGGIYVLYQRAVEGQSYINANSISDVMFGFSSWTAEIEKESGSEINHYIITGYLGDFRFPLIKLKAQELRQKLLDSGVKQILAFFDENSNGDDRWHTGHDFMRVNYEFLLKKILEDSTLGLIIKPKAPTTLHQRLGKIRNLLEEAIKTGRCIVLDQGHFYGDFPPVYAGLASDIAIHGHFCAATAGVECALAGVPTVLLDREGNPSSELNCLGEGRIVFRDWESLWSGIQSYFKGNGEIGNWSEHLDMFDPFRDGRAMERMTDYLSWLYEGFNQGFSREEVMKNASVQYADKWGSQYIKSINC